MYSQLASTCSKLAIETLEEGVKQHFTICSSVSIVNFEQVNAGWARSSWKETEMSIVII